MWNLIFGQSSYSEIRLIKKIKKKKKSGTQVPFKELEFHIFLFFIFKISVRYNSIIQKSSFKTEAFP